MLTWVKKEAVWVKTGELPKGVRKVRIVREFKTPKGDIFSTIGYPPKEAVELIERAVTSGLTGDTVRYIILPVTIDSDEILEKKREALVKARAVRASMGKKVKDGKREGKGRGRGK